MVFIDEVGKRYEVGLLKTGRDLQWHKAKCDEFLLQFVMLLFGCCL